MLLIIFLSSIIITYYLCRNINSIKGLPPGPTPWPFIGNTFTMPGLDGIDLQLNELRKLYGDVFTVWIPYPTVVICSYDALKRNVIKNGEAFAGRPTLYLMEAIVEGNYGLFFEENRWYKAQRKFALTTLRSLGLRTKEMRSTICSLAHQLTDRLAETKGEPIYIRNELTVSVGNVINQLIFGWTRSRDDKEIIWFMNMLNKVLEHFTSPSILLLDIMPWLRHFDCVFHFGLKSTLEANDAILNFLNKQLEIQKKQIDYNQEPTNFIESFLIEQRNREINSITSDDGFNEKQLIVAIYDIYSAGLETTVIVMRFAILNLLKNPEMQQKVIDEIDANIGQRDVTMNDTILLPYLCAVLEETYRLGYVMPVNFLRATMEDVTCEGYHLPCGTRVIAQFPSVHTDEKEFTNATKFDPERFLHNGEFRKDERVIPFSVGRRACIGESLARAQVFITIVTILQKFTLRPEGETMEDLGVQVSALRAPLPFKVRCIARN